MSSSSCASQFQSVIYQRHPNLSSIEFVLACSAMPGVAKKQAPSMQQLALMCYCSLTESCDVLFVAKWKDTKRMIVCLLLCVHCHRLLCVQPCDLETSPARHYGPGWCAACLLLISQLPCVPVITCPCQRHVLPHPVPNSTM